MLKHTYDDFTFQAIKNIQIKIKLGKQLSEEAENAPSRLSG